MSTGYSGDFVSSIYAELYNSTTTKSYYSKNIYLYNGKLPLPLYYSRNTFI